MKRIIFVILILISALGLVFAQTNVQKPLTQSEYVKMLYALEKKPDDKAALIEAVRTRGIGFELTDGLRGLTRTKSKNDEELRRTLEEANRRRQNPATAMLPTEKEAAEILAKSREATLALVDEMPDFTVKQLIKRSIAYAGTNNWKQLDNLTIAVNYSTDKGENYKVLAINGAAVNAESGSNYNGLDGATSGGEFVEELAWIFRPESKTEFKVVDTDVLRTRPTIIYEYKIALANNKKGGISYKRYISESVPTGQKGKIWVDRNNFRVLRIETEETDMPSTFPVKALNKIIDYDWADIAGQKYLLPILSDIRFTALSDGQLLQTLNVIRFKNYQKYGSEVQISDDDEEVKEEKP